MKSCVKHTINLFYFTCTELLPQTPLGTQAVLGSWVSGAQRCPPGSYIDLAVVLKVVLRPFLALKNSYEIPDLLILKPKLCLYCKLSKLFKWEKNKPEKSIHSFVCARHAFTVAFVA